jgi:ABC-type antimicrobial peptide transport system permease subunit
VLAVRTRTDSPEQVIPAVRDIVRRLDPAVPVHKVATMASLVERAAAKQRFVMRLLIGFAVIALGLAAVGLYGVISYAVARRAREVGVRMALGASPGDIIRLVIAGGAGAIVVGIAAGLAGALVLTRYLGTLLYGVDARDPVTFAAAVAILALVALAAHAIPLRRAVRIDPAIALRQE